MKRTTMAIALAVAVAGAAPAEAQIPGLGDAARVFDRVPSLSSFFEGDPPITTSLDDARTEIAFLDGWSPAGWQRLDALPRTNAGAFRLRPGRFAMEAQSYCMHAGTHGPGGGDGYLYAPLAGSKAGIVQSLLRNSASHPEIPQRDIQVLIWAIIARTEFDEMPSEMQRTARALLTRDQVDDLDDGALGEVPESVMREAMRQLPPVAQQVFRAEAQLRSMISSGTSNFAALERVAVLTGAVEPPEGSRPVPAGRWSFDPDGYFVRYDPSGYSRTRVEVSVPAPVVIARDAQGRIAGIYGSYGRRLQLDAAPPSAGPSSAASVLAAVLGSGRPTAAALRDLAELEALARSLRVGGTAVGDGAAAPGGAAPEHRAFRADADLVMEAWQATFCQAAGCPGFPSGEDVLVLRSGATLRGALRWCAADTCVLGATAFGLDEIEWIGLARANPSPPAAVNSDVGEVHEGNGSVEAGNLLSLGDQLVLTDAGGHDRPDVAWIHLVSGDEDLAPDPPIGGVSGDDPQPPRVQEEDVQPEEEDGEGEEDPGDGADGEEYDGPVYDPSDDVATPGNRGRQRLAQSSRSHADEGGGADGEEDACAGERRNAAQAEALFFRHLQLMNALSARIMNELGIDPSEWATYSGPGERLIHEYDEMNVQHDVLLESWGEAMRLLQQCEAAAG